MNDLIIHRGPDDEGFYFGENFAFGHRRLAILDLSSDGHQPMSYLDKYIITYNGEIYNFIELREELQRYGYHFQSKTDTEVILASYHQWGNNCVEKFNGMWSFAIYDKDNKTLFLSRDRFGVKPMYYIDLDDKFVFGSEIKQLLSFKKKWYVNKKILMDYLLIGFEDHTNETFFEGVKKLGASHNMTYNLKTHKYKKNQYYDFYKEPQNLSESASIADYQKKLFDSIRLRMRSDVKVGTCLSGGLDSSSVAAIASKIYRESSQDKFIAIHAQSSEQKNDESQFAEAVVRHCDLDLATIQPTLEDFRNHIDEVIYTQEEPFGGPSVFMQYFLMEKSKALGCTVLLDGQGGDETLLGYERYYAAYINNLNFIDSFKFYLSSVKNSKLSLARLFAYTLYFTNSKLRISRIIKKNRYIKKEYLQHMSLKAIEKSTKSYKDIFSLQHGEIFSTQMPHLLRYEDKNSMMHSIETRLPFIDYRLVEFAVNTDSKFKIKNGWTKYILRKAIESFLPRDIVWRKNKLGFESPTQTWLASIDGEMHQSIKNSNIIKKIKKEVTYNRLSLSQKWRLYNVAKWEEIYSIHIK